jgi:urea transport system permease protein
VLTGVDDSTLEKVRINNRVRGMLRANIARIMLTQGTAAERESAAVSILDNLDEETTPLLEQALANEKEAKVRTVLAVGLAMQSVLTATDDVARIKALKTLDGRLEAPVRNLLTSIMEDSTGKYSAEVKALTQTTLASIQSRIQLYKFVEQLFFGLSLGSVLLLAATGLAVTFGVMGVINMAHGEMLMLGAYTTYVVQMLMPNAINQSLWVAIPAAFIVTALVGMLIQRFVIRYLNGRPLETLLATFGISLILQQAVRTVFSPLNRLVSSPDWMSGSFQINAVFSLTSNRVFILLFSLIVFAILQLVLRKTSLGLHVRAVSQNRAMAQAMGIRTDIVDALTFGLGSGIAGIAGVALSQLTNVGPNLGQSYIIDSFMVVVFGGVGNLLGTLLAAFSLGMANKFLEPLTGAVLANILILVFIILFIQKRPKGLFPQKGRAAD